MEGCEWAEGVLEKGLASDLGVKAVFYNSRSSTGKVYFIPLTRPFQSAQIFLGVVFVMTVSPDPKTYMTTVTLSSKRLFIYEFIFTSVPSTTTEDLTRLKGYHCGEVYGKVLFLGGGAGQEGGKGVTQKRRVDKKVHRKRNQISYRHIVALAFFP